MPQPPSPLSSTTTTTMCNDKVRLRLSTGSRSAPFVRTHNGTQQSAHNMNTHRPTKTKNDKNHARTVSAVITQEAYTHVRCDAAPLLTEIMSSALSIFAHLAPVSQPFRAGRSAIDDTAAAGCGPFKAVRPCPPATSVQASQPATMTAVNAATHARAPIYA